MKLETLKDLEFGRTEKEDRKMLRQEAIKWIKFIEKDGKPDNFVSLTISSAANEIMKAIATKESSIVIDWIKHFFNISEDDLK